MSASDGTFDAATLFDDDALLDTIAAGGPVADGQLGVLATWRAELVQATPTPSHDITRLPGSGLTARRRSLVRAAVATATAAAVVTGGGVAAAAVSGVDGPFGGLHRIIFGTATGGDDALTRAAALLDHAQRRITVGQRAGQITASESDGIAAILTRADALITAEPHAPEALSQRLHTLQDAFAALPIAPGASTLPEPTDRPSAPGIPIEPPAPSASAAHNGNADENGDGDDAPGPNRSSAGGRGGSDTSGSDTGGSDTGGSDTGGSDTGGSDTGSSDTGSSDTGSSDTGSSDTGSSDTGSSDTGSSDTGGSDTGGSDGGG